MCVLIYTKFTAPSCVWDEIHADFSMSLQFSPIEHWFSSFVFLSIEYWNVKLIHKTKALLIPHSHIFWMHMHQKTKQNKEKTLQCKISLLKAVTLSFQKCT